MQQVTIRWQSKTFRVNVAWHTGTTIGLLSLSREFLKGVFVKMKGGIGVMLKISAFDRC